ncbi:MAG: hypothetical protein Kow0081_1350 [Candidatus Dojkabacteria bacterium]
MKFFKIPKPIFFLTISLLFALTLISSLHVKAAFNPADCVQNFGNSCIDKQKKPRCLSPYTEACGSGCQRNVTCGSSGEFLVGECICEDEKNSQCPVATIWNGSICEGTAKGTDDETKDQQPVENGGEIVADKERKPNDPRTRSEANLQTVGGRGGTRISRGGGVIEIDGRRYRNIENGCFQALVECVSEDGLLSNEPPSISNYREFKCINNDASLRPGDSGYNANMTLYCPSNFDNRSATCGSSSYTYQDLVNIALSNSIFEGVDRNYLNARVSEENEYLVIVTNRVVSGESIDILLECNDNNFVVSDESINLSRGTIETWREPQQTNIPLQGLEDFINEALEQPDNPENEQTFEDISEFSEAVRRCVEERFPNVRFERLEVTETSGNLLSGSHIFGSYNFILDDSGYVSEARFLAGYKDVRGFTQELLEQVCNQFFYYINQEINPNQQNSRNELPILSDNQTQQGRTSIFPKVNAQTVPPTPELLDPEQLDRGVYVLNIPNFQTAEFRIYNDNVKVNYFVDANGDGIKQDNEEYIDVKQYEIQIERKASIKKFTFEKGWNLINFPLISNEFNTAEKLFSRLSDSGINALQISTYSNGKWIHYVQRVNENGEIVYFGTDFNLVPGQGYFINSLNPGTVILEGNRINSSVPLFLEIGWNLVGIINPVRKYSAESLLETCNIDGKVCRSINKWVNGANYYETYEDFGGSFFGNNFEILEDTGYFIESIAEKTLNP